MLVIDLIHKFGDKMHRPRAVASRLVAKTKNVARFEVLNKFA